MKTGTWLLLLYALPTRRNAERVNLWRKLKKFGAVQLKTSGYVLPDKPEQLERFQWLSKQILDAGGEADVIRIAEIQGVSNDEVIRRFNEARAVDYKELAANCQQALSRNKKGKAPEFTLAFGKLKERFGEIKEIDYFDAPAAHDAQMLLQRVEKSLGAKAGVGSVERLERSQYMGKTWLTRPRPGIDRAGSAWLIRKFIDPNASFIFGMEAAKHSAALPFDMAGVEFSHQGEDCTFETLVKRFGLKDAAVLLMAEMVHDADLEDEKFHRCECIGINAVLSGWAKTDMKDPELLAKGIECFEGLYRQLRK